MRQHMSRDMTKPTKWVCAQRRLRSALYDKQEQKKKKVTYNYIIILWENDKMRG